MSVGYKNPPKHTRWKPGQSGNPKGRPKRPDLLTLNKLIAEADKDDRIAETWVQQALGDPEKGIEPDFRFFKLLIEYRNGSVPQVVDDPETTADEKPRIIIPGAKPDEGGSKAKRSPRKRKSS